MAYNGGEEAGAEGFEAELNDILEHIVEGEGDMEAIDVNKLQKELLDRATARTNTRRPFTRSTGLKRTIISLDNDDPTSATAYTRKRRRRTASEAALIKVKPTNPSRHLTNKQLPKSLKKGNAVLLGRALGTNQPPGPRLEIIRAADFVYFFGFNTDRSEYEGIANFDINDTLKRWRHATNAFLRNKVWRAVEARPDITPSDAVVTRLLLWREQFNRATPFFLRAMFPLYTKVDFTAMAADARWSGPSQDFFSVACEIVFKHRHLLVRWSPAVHINLWK
ncbi:hypothetical protein MMC10_000443 [Thelotrema lepadinum]|nr:hypothetical protein [Thelotrema lepadinum]